MPLPRLSGDLTLDGLRDRRCPAGGVTERSKDKSPSLTVATAHWPGSSVVPSEVYINDALVASMDFDFAPLAITIMKCKACMIVLLLFCF